MKRLGCCFCLSICNNLIKKNVASNQYETVVIHMITKFQVSNVIRISIIFLHLLFHPDTVIGVLVVIKRLLSVKVQPFSYLHAYVQKTKYCSPYPNLWQSIVVDPYLLSFLYTGVVLYIVELCSRPE